MVAGYPVSDVKLRCWEVSSTRSIVGNPHLFLFMDIKHIRNFSVIAHIDHGKSTLADRFLELTGALQAREMEAQVLDAMDLERERGITIKAHPVRLHYTATGGETYVLNLIDTPGHVDFSYEVTRSLAACEGALLLVDASQGVEAQTLANAYLAVNNGSRSFRSSTRSICRARQPADAGDDRADRRDHRPHGCDPRERQDGPGVPDDPRSDRPSAAAARRRSGRAAQGAHLRFLVRRLPRRVIVVRVIDGVLSPGMKIRLMAEGRTSIAAGRHTQPKPVEIEELAAGEVGFFVANIKNVADTKIGDTVTETRGPRLAAFPGFQDIKSMVFAGLYTVDATSTRCFATRSKSCA